MAAWIPLPRHRADVLETPAPTPLDAGLAAITSTPIPPKSRKRVVISAFR